MLKQLAYEQRRSAAFEALVDRITQQATKLRRLTLRQGIRVVHDTGQR